MSTVLDEVQEAASQRYFHLRDVRWADSGNGKDYTFEGRASTFNSWSEPLWTPRGWFRERIRPGAFSMVLAQKPDVRLLKNHDKNLVLARTKSGTLDLEETEDALRVWARIARTSYATDLRMSMERGDIDGMSFLFETDYDKGADDHWYVDDDSGEVRRDVRRVSDLIEVTIATFPAYAETDAVMREIRMQEMRRTNLSNGYKSAKLHSGGVVIDEARASDPPLLGSAQTLDASGIAEVKPKVNTAERRFTPRQYSRCRQVVSETPWAIKPTYLDMILGILSERIEGVRLTDEEIKTRIGSQRSNEPTNEGSVAVVPLVGPIFSRAGAMQQVSGTKSLDLFREQFRAAIQDTSVKAVLLDVDSPGGTADMIPETAMEIRAARSQKPVIAIANAMSASAAYWLASAASEFVCTPSGEVGSIGVYASHTDVSKKMESEGQKTTIVKAGKYKAELNQFEPLTEEAHARLQNDVDAIYKSFIKDVARNRMTTMGDVTANFGQGRTVMAEEALASGMIDSIETFEQVLARLQTAVGSEMTPKAQVAFWDNGTSMTDVTSFGNTATTSASGTNVTVTATQPQAASYTGPIPTHSAEVVDKTWDGPAAQRRVKASQSALRSLHAWVDSGEDSNLKGSYKFPHHEVDESGNPGAANINGVRNALSRLPDSSIPASDKPGVRAHLDKHMSDFKGEEMDDKTPDSEKNETAFESRDNVRDSLGLGAAWDKPADTLPDASTQVAEENSLAALKAKSKNAMQRAREDKVRLTKAMLS
jgi:HK97 family phage prohead protease